MSTRTKPDEQKPDAPTGDIGTAGGAGAMPGEITLIPIDDHLREQKRHEFEALVKKFVGAQLSERSYLQIGNRDTNVPGPSDQVVKVAIIMARKTLTYLADIAAKGA